MIETTTTEVRSMTGQGHASIQSELGSVTVEVRTVNNRGFKCSPRVSDSLSSLETKIESLTRSLVHRGSVTLSVSWRRPPGENLPGVDQEVLLGYVNQLKQIRQQAGDETPVTIDLATLMTLPGVLTSTREDRRKNEELWQFIRSAIVAAIDNLNEMRAAEGRNMAESLVVDVSQIESRVAVVAKLAPRAVDAYQARLETKIQRILAERQIEAQPIDLLREIQVYADRADISEEITRLESHLKMFGEILSADRQAGGRPEPTGRKLDFVIQEMFRETNTIGSKAADAKISAHVVEMKCAIERMRELVQNLE